MRETYEAALKNTGDTGNMITAEQMVAAAETDEIRALDLSALDEGDVVNLIAQRSEIIFDEDDPDGVVKHWAAGREGPARDLVQARGDELTRRAAGIIRAEYEEIREDIAAIKPKSIADIGCGYAMFDLFFWRDFPGKIILIDLEDSEDRHFGYRQDGAAYSNLAKAKTFLTDNGVTAKQITLVNPQKKALPKTKVSLAVSFISCGFHYPVQTYEAYFRDQVTATGAIILDVRRRRVKDARPVLEALGEMRELTGAANGKAARLMVQKG